MKGRLRTGLVSRTCAWGWLAVCKTNLHMGPHTGRQALQLLCMGLLKSYKPYPWNPSTWNPQSQVQQLSRSWALRLIYQC